MRSASSIVAAATLVSLAAAGDAPVAKTDLTTGLTYTATLPNAGVDAITGAILGAVSPDGVGTNFQVSFYNLPGSGSLSYALYTGRISNGDCNTAGAVLDPYAGTTGSSCLNNQAGCQVGDLSDKHGAAKILSGGSGTGYFAANYIDKYVSMDPSNEAFFGKGSFVIKDSTGVAVGCANFINASKVRGNSTTTDSSSSSSMGPSSTGSGNGNGGSGSGSAASSSTSDGGAMKTAAPFVGAGILGMAALLI